MIFVSGNSSSIAFPSFRVTARLTSASVEKSPFAPGSIPPCPASRIMVRMAFFEVWQKLYEKKKKAAKRHNKVRDGRFTGKEVRQEIALMMKFFLLFQSFPKRHSSLLQASAYYFVRCY